MVSLWASPVAELITFSAREDRAAIATVAAVVRNSLRFIKCPAIITASAMQINPLPEAHLLAEERDRFQGNRLRFPRSSSEASIPFEIMLSVMELHFSGVVALFDPYIGAVIQLPHTFFSSVSFPLPFRQRDLVFWIDFGKYLARGILLANRTRDPRPCRKWFAEQIELALSSPLPVAGRRAQWRDPTSARQKRTRYEKDPRG